MRRRAPLLLSIGLVAWLWLIGILTFVPLQIGGSLRGATEPASTPTWTFHGLIDGSVFRATENWFSSHVGLHNLWVRLDNQLTYTLFNESPIRPTGTRVVIGKDGWLFEHAYIKAAITPSKVPTKQLAELATLIRRVQDKLARRGPQLLLIIAPSKAEIYPEHVPSVYFAGQDPARITTTYEKLRPLLNQAGVVFYDGPERFTAWKAEGQEHLFARTGTHWSYHAIYHVIRDIRNLLNPRLHRPIPALDLVSVDYHPPQETDTDLHRLLNLLTPAFGQTDQPLPVLHPQTSVSAENLPRLLWVNDSFGLGLLDVLYEANVMQPTDCLYYFKNVYQLPGLRKSNREINELDLPNYVHEFDAVVVVFTEISIEQQGWGFFEALDAALD